ncbi:hypothetical protein TRFO_04960 [Tritrichomonas foetus]|uniref:Uncharacterized protein n=1 Tax=Tritrichomonas foetus TaxID=1144522 RepID=A0A1J4KBQ1_9EUKA|nr:hypothetical protein TRFO_04960 [Tritrichomonas foetus]|eukprot:OHT08336.1 hypothetical protein TRFO_04960 [Tritrichomonas foetus]
MEKAMSQNVIRPNFMDHDAFPNISQPFPNFTKQYPLYIFDAPTGYGLPVLHALLQLLPHVFQNSIYSAFILPDNIDRVYIEASSLKSIQMTLKHISGIGAIPKQLSMIQIKSLENYFCNPVKCLHFHPGQIVTISNPEFHDQIAQVLDLKKDKAKILLKTYPHIDYENLALHPGLNSQEKLNHLMPQNYKAPTVPFKQEGLSTTCSNIVFWNSHINVIKWDGKNFIGKFQYIWFSCDEVNIKYEVTEEEMAMFEEGISPYEKRNQKFLDCFHGHLNLENFHSSEVLLKVLKNTGIPSWARERRKERQNQSNNQTTDQNHNQNNISNDRLNNYNNNNHQNDYHLHNHNDYNNNNNNNNHFSNYNHNNHSNIDNDHNSRNSFSYYGNHKSNNFDSHNTNTNIHRNNGNNNELNNMKERDLNDLNHVNRENDFESPNDDIPSLYESDSHEIILEEEMPSDKQNRINTRNLSPSKDAKNISLKTKNSHKSDSSDEFHISSSSSSNNDSYNSKLVSDSDSEQSVTIIDDLRNKHSLTQNGNEEQARNRYQHNHNRSSPQRNSTQSRRLVPSKEYTASQFSSSSDSDSSTSDDVQVISISQNIGNHSKKHSNKSHEKRPPMEIRQRKKEKTDYNSLLLKTLDLGNEQPSENTFFSIEPESSSDEDDEQEQSQLKEYQPKYNPQDIFKEQSQKIFKKKSRKYYRDKGMPIPDDYLSLSSDSSSDD